MDRLRPGKRLYPRDLRFFWRALAAIGVNERLGTPHASTDDQMREVLSRVRPILDACSSAKEPILAPPNTNPGA